MKFKSLSLLLALIASMGTLFSQTEIGFPLLSHIKEGSTMEWLWMKANSNLNFAEMWSLMESSIDLDDRSEFALVSEEMDDLGMTHHRVQHHLSGIKVEGSEYLVHSSGNSVLHANGHVVLGDFPSLEPITSIYEACIVAHEYVPAIEYVWQPSSTSNPQPLPIWELTLAQGSSDPHFNAKEYRLAYRIEVETKIPYGGWNIFVDALNGKIIKEVPFIMNCVGGTGNTLYNGNQDIDTEDRGFLFNDYFLKDDCRGKYIRTYKKTNSGRSNVYDGDNNWASQDRAEVSIHWAAEKTYDYFLSAHGRNSVNDNGRRLKLMYREDTASYGAFNASWDASKDEGSFGFGDGVDPFVSLDIVGHEITHGVVFHTSELNYAGESGALNESFADIFGTCVEHYAVGLFGPQNTEDWTIGEDIAGSSFRSLEDPELFNHPDFFLDPNWVPITPNCNGTNDYCGVHTNSGVQNRWFYLLSEGGTVTDGLLPNGTVSVCGIGMEDAGRIAYRNLRFYLTKYGGFQDARMGAIQAAEDLFAAGSFEARQCINAWHAVGLGGMVEECEPVDVLEAQLAEYVKISVFPNPVTEYSRLALEVYRPISLDIKMYDLQGGHIPNFDKHVKISKPGKYSSSLDFVGLPSGIYLLKVQYQDQHILKKVIIL